MKGDALAKNDPPTWDELFLVVDLLLAIFVVAWVLIGLFL